ncbi:hypothetical protein [Natronoglycomyces albus]|uniref:Uncharacterized protein n=1 Tax=Natronoglycomyces albus TaxID=2811108 RepID=A0A895XH07_9ACTN|nr:hypothetical protein [Natronoglycomyces albus]QSB05131.1 hypothetical protein JQS30_15440 [Natronoglycomyces albus]
MKSLKLTLSIAIISALAIWGGAFYLIFSDSSPEPYVERAQDRSLFVLHSKGICENLTLDLGMGGQFQMEDYGDTRERKYHDRSDCRQFYVDDEDLYFTVSALVIYTVMRPDLHDYQVRSEMDQAKWNPSASAPSNDDAVTIASGDVPGWDRSTYECWDHSSARSHSKTCSFGAEIGNLAMGVSLSFDFPENKTFEEVSEEDLEEQLEFVLGSIEVVSELMKDIHELLPDLER